MKRFQLPRRSPHDHATVTRAKSTESTALLAYQHAFSPSPSSTLITPSKLCLISAVFWRLLKSDQQIREHLLGHCGSRRVSDAVEKLLSASESVGRNLRLGAAASLLFLKLLAAPADCRVFASPRLTSRSRCVPLRATRLLVNLLSRHFFFIVVSTEKKQKVNLDPVGAKRQN